MRAENIGSSFEDFLKEEGWLEEISQRAAKRVLARQLEAAMRTAGLTKASMARRMGTSRPALDRLLDPENTSVTLRTLQRAAIAVGKRLEIDLVDTEAPSAREG